MKKNNNKKLLDNLSEYKVKCKKCGHVVIMIKRKRLMCNWCGSMIYKNDKEEFKQKLRSKLR